MKSTVVAVAAAVLAGGVNAGRVHAHRNAHQALFERKPQFNESEVCVPSCTTIYSTIVGEPTSMLPCL
jgi:hypothetical protein